MTLPANPEADRLRTEHVIDRHGLVWRVVRDGGMATRADYTGITSIGIEELRATRGPLTDLDAALARERQIGRAEALRDAKAALTKYDTSQYDFLAILDEVAGLNASESPPTEEEQR